MTSGEMAERRVVFAPVAALMAVVVLTAVLVIAATRVHHPTSTATQTHVWPLPSGYRQACRGTVTSDCARRTALRVGHEVAWLPPGPTVTTEGMVYRRGKASVELSFGAPTGLLDSGPDVPPNAPNLPSQFHTQGTYRYSALRLDGTTLHVLTTAVGNLAFTKLTWTHGGQTFSLGETSSATRPPDVAPLVTLWRQVRYTATANV
jgi:hypothetical protein